MKFRVLDAKDRLIGKTVEALSFDEAIAIIKDSGDGPKYFWKEVSNVDIWDYKIADEANRCIHFRLTPKPKLESK